MHDTPSPHPPTSAEIRATLVETLELDLFGPTPGHACERELLAEPPHLWYLGGFLAPFKAPAADRSDPTSGDELDAAPVPQGGDDDAHPDRGAASTGQRAHVFPSSIGISVLVDGETDAIDVTATWGDYVAEELGDAELRGAPAGRARRGGEVAWRRIPCTWSLRVDLKEVVKAGGTKIMSETGDEGMHLTVAVRTAGAAGPLDAGTRVVSVFLVNGRVPNVREPQLAFAFQARLELACARGFLGRRDLRTTSLGDEWDERVAELQYRDVSEYAVGHGVSTTTTGARTPSSVTERAATPTANGRAASSPPPHERTASPTANGRAASSPPPHERTASPTANGRAASSPPPTTITTTWLPLAEVERTEPSRIDGVELGMEILGSLPTPADARRVLQPMVDLYRTWISAQRAGLPGLAGPHAQTATDMFNEAVLAAARIEQGIACLDDPVVFDSFRIANRAVATAFRRRVAQSIDGGDPHLVAAPSWRPFQLAYVLMTLAGIADPLHADRKRVDLLFFPTGGGKTEAYLGLAAFTLVLRRLRAHARGGQEADAADAAGSADASIAAAGVTVLMRYTLRLLTLDQLGRAAGLVCALELERRANAALGSWPFEIGLWVGSGATPNQLGRRGDKSASREYSAYTKLQRFKSDSAHNAAPIPLESCPWCGTRFTANSFELVPDLLEPKDLRVHCASPHCAFNGDAPLPIVAVDEPLYRRLPCFLIATVDKFAALPWSGHAATLFGRVQRWDEDGFYGPMDPGRGRPLPAACSEADGAPALLPPDLVIQDELHLISGPLGTIAGLYETAIDALCARRVDGVEVRPKIIASTATVRRADAQIRALFGRDQVSVFPPPAPDRRDSFFARVVPADERPARLYVGIAAQGRSLKVVLMRTALALLSAAQKAWDASGTATYNAADPYMTLLGYFNALRELGGSRRIIEDEVRTRLLEYGTRRRLEPADDLFARRELDLEAVELTSRVGTGEIAQAKRRLEQRFDAADRVDVALATNMISVGLDIMRLGLMVVVGQPKSAAEYIQATSRVGRDADRPGLVVTLLNLHKPRDRSHYERFGMFHATFYRSVEAASVTPFAPRALDRALAATLVALCRLDRDDLTPALAAQRILTARASLDVYADQIAARAAAHRASFAGDNADELRAHVRARCAALLDAWLLVAKEPGADLQYQRESDRSARRLLHDFLDPALDGGDARLRLFRSGRSMRDVEPEVLVEVEKSSTGGAA